MAAQLGYGSCEDLLAAYLNEPTIQTAFAEGLPKENIKRQMYEFFERECFFAGKRVEEIIVDGPLSEVDLSMMPVDEVSTAPPRFSPVAMRFAAALSFSDADAMLAAWQSSDEPDFFVGE